jgi:hypothetical protein
VATVEEIAVMHHQRLNAHQLKWFWNICKNVTLKVIGILFTTQKVNGKLEGLVRNG